MEEGGVATAATGVGAALGDGVHDLDARLVRPGDEPGDVDQRPGGAGDGGELGQRAVGADDAALALDGQQHGGRRVGPVGGLFLRRHAAPSSCRPVVPPRPAVVVAGRVRLAGIAPAGEGVHAF